MKHVFWLSILIILSCNREEREIKDIIDKWQNRQIYFPECVETKIYGRDTILPEWASNQYKILNYIDTNGCTPCRLKFFEWKMFLLEAQKMNLNISLLFVVYATDYRLLEIVQKENGFDYPIIYDRKDSINLLNNFPKNANYQTFLLDDQNKVILVGSPVRNDSMWELYKNTMIDSLPKTLSHN